MTWYHLSYNSRFVKIVPSNGPKQASFLKPSIPSWIKRLKPEDIYREPEKPLRVCVSPSVWQCVSASGRYYGNPTGEIYIYEVCTEQVLERTFNSPETGISDEHWITDEILDRYNGSIEMRNIGKLVLDDIFIELKKNYRPDSVLKRMKSVDEINLIWIIKEKQGSDRVWTLNNEGLAKIRS